MQEGWSANDYLILFDAVEVAAVTSRYELAKYLPNYTICGIRGWDDFIVMGPTGATFTVPCVPLDAIYMEPYTVPMEPLVPEKRLVGNIKWYVTPIVFGGSPRIAENATWVSHDEHVQLVAFWNKQYYALKGS